MSQANEARQNFLNTKTIQDETQQNNLLLYYADFLNHSAGETITTIFLLYLQILERNCSTRDDYLYDPTFCFEKYRS